LEKEEEEEKKRIPLIGDAGFAHFFLPRNFSFEKPTVLQKEMTHHISHPEKFTQTPATTISFKAVLTY
jgi:hypothetical protein